MKTCRVCGRARPIGDFRQGHNRCKTCTADYRRQYRLANLDAERDANARWYAANRELKIESSRVDRAANRDAICTRRREWYGENRDGEAARDKRRYEIDPEKRRENSRRWARENPERNAAKQHQRRAVVRSLQLSDEDFAYMAILRRDPCAYCGGASGTVDHIEPLDSGGDGRWDNLTASCRSCNSSKSTAALLAFLTRV